MELPSIVVVPKKSFFDGQLTIPWARHPTYTKHFNLDSGKKTKDITLKIKGKKYSAKICKSYQKAKKRHVIHLIWKEEYKTKKAMRKLFMYSYAATIRGNKPQLKECVKFEHIEHSDEFKVVPIAQQKTDFDEMFDWMEDHDYFDLWKDKDKPKKRESMFQSKKRDPIWYSVNDLKKYADSTYVIYLLHHSKKNQFYVGQAEKLGKRVKKGSNGGRKGLDDDWDKFMFFQLEPEKWNEHIDELEDWAIRLFASILSNDIPKLKLKPINANKLHLVNRAALRKK